jgi:hypothetical protein
MESRGQNKLPLLASVTVGYQNSVNMVSECYCLEFLIGPKLDDVCSECSVFEVVIVFVM